MDVARESGLAEGPAPELAPSSLARWAATCYQPRRTDVLARAHVPSADQDSSKVIDMKRHLALGGKWLAGAAGITGLGYLATTESVGGKHPVWPYWLFAAMLVAGLALYFACQERTSKRAPRNT